MLRGCLDCRYRSTSRSSFRIDNHARGVRRPFRHRIPHRLAAGSGRARHGRSALPAADSPGHRRQSTRQRSRLCRPQFALEEK